MVLVGRTDPEEAGRMVLVDRTINGADHMGRVGRKAEGAGHMGQVGRKAEGAGHMVLVGRTDPEEAGHMGRVDRKAEGADRNPEEAAHIQAEEDIDPLVGRNPGVGTDPEEDIDP